MRSGARALAGALVLALLVGPGCKKRRAHVDPLTLNDEDHEAIARERVEGPVRWEDPGGRLCVDVPAGWAGWRGWRRGGPIVTLEHTTGAAVAVYEGPPPEQREGYSRIFEDEATWRDVPILFPASTVTWIAEPGQPTILEWYGGPPDRILRVELTLPWGRIIQGRLASDALLHGLCVPQK